MWAETAGCVVLICCVVVFYKGKESCPKDIARLNLAAAAKAPSRRVFFWGDSNLRELVRSGVGTEFFDGIPNHVVSPSLPTAMWTVCTGGWVTRVVVRGV